jgi:hypothetical protein
MIRYFCSGKAACGETGPLWASYGKDSVCYGLVGRDKITPVVYETLHWYFLYLVMTKSNSLKKPRSRNKSAGLSPDQGELILWGRTAKMSI